MTPILPLPQHLTPARTPEDRRRLQRERQRAWRARHPEIVRVEVTIDVDLRDGLDAVAAVAGVSVSDLVRDSLAHRVTCGGRSTAIREHLLGARVSVGRSTVCPLEVREGMAARLDAEVGALLWRLGGERAPLREYVERVATCIEESRHVDEVFATKSAWRRCVREALMAAGLTE